MRIALVPAILLAVSASTGAYAQSQQGASGSSAQQTTQHSARSAKAVEDSLKQAGIQDVKTIDAAYLVSAKTKEGQNVTIFIDPPGAAGASSGQSGSQGTSGQQQLRDNLSKAGFTNVTIMDAAYLVSGKTKDGDRVTMMVDPSMTTGTTMPSSSGVGRANPPAAGSGSSANPATPSTKQ